MGQGNVGVHSQVEQCYRCKCCGHMFAAIIATPFYRLRTAADVMTLVRSLLCHGSPLQASIAALGFDERTVAAWLTRAGLHGQQVDQQVVRYGAVDWQHDQADEAWVKLVGRRGWMAMGMRVPSRLWLGGTSVYSATWP